MGDPRTEGIQEMSILTRRKGRMIEEGVRGLPRPSFTGGVAGRLERSELKRGATQKKKEKKDKR